MLTGSSGNDEGAITYDAYGNVTGTSGTATTPLGYDGQYTSPDTGLIYLKARVYDPKTAQFLSVDPDEAETGEPYSYAGDNPTNGGDPSGEQDPPPPSILPVPGMVGPDQPQTPPVTRYFGLPDYDAQAVGCGSISWALGLEAFSRSITPPSPFSIFGNDTPEAIVYNPNRPETVYGIFSTLPYTYTSSPTFTSPITQHISNGAFSLGGFHPTPYTSANFGLIPGGLMTTFSTQSFILDISTRVNNLHLNDYIHDLRHIQSLPGDLERHGGWIVIRLRW
jgi:RHS repeat-associated protein